MSSNIFVTFGALAGTEQLQTRTRTGALVNQIQTRTRNATSGTTSNLYQRTRSITSSTNYTRYTRSYSEQQVCTGVYLYETTGSACSGSCLTASCAEGVTYCRTRFGPTGCQYFGSSITTVCTYGNWNTSTVSSLCQTLTGEGTCTEEVQYCTTGSTTCTEGTWSSWTINNSCTTSTTNCGGNSYTTRECDTFSSPVCSTGSWSSWTNATSCNQEYGTDNCSGTLTTDCQTISVCQFGDWTNWTDAVVCDSASPSCTVGAVQRECRIV
jgi:hypothetical protein